MSIYTFSVVHNLPRYQDINPTEIRRVHAEKRRRICDSGYERYEECSPVRPMIILYDTSPPNNCYCDLHPMNHYQRSIELRKQEKQLKDRRLRRRNSRQSRNKKRFNIQTFRKKQKKRKKRKRKSINNETADSNVNVYKYDGHMQTSLNMFQEPLKKKRKTSSTSIDKNMNSFANENEDEIMTGDV